MYQEQSFEERFDDLKALVGRFEKILKGEVDGFFIDEDSFLQLIDYYDDHENLPRAIKAANMGMRQFPYSAELQIKKASLLNAMGQFDKALDLLENAEVLNPTDVNLYIHKADAFLGLNMVSEATAILHGEIDRFAGEERREILLELNEVFDDWEAHDDAFDCLVMLLKEDPQNEEALRRISFWAEYTGRVEESIKLHQGIIDEYPFNAQAWFNLGCAFQDIKLYEKAIDTYGYVLAIEDDFEFVRRNMADAFIRMRKYDKALEILEECLEKEEEDSAVYEAMGYCYEKNKAYGKARSCYREALQLSPDDDNLFFRIGHAFMVEESWKQAISFIAAASKINPGKLEYHLALGECFRQLDRLEDAVTQFLASIEIRPSSKRSRLALIKVLYESGCYEEALQQLDLAEKETRYTVDYNYYRCAILLALGKNKEAFIQLEIAMSEAPGKLKVLSRLDPAVLQHKGVTEVLSRFS